MNDLMIPSRAEVPAYILNPELARQANEEAIQGITTGAPPRIKLSGKQFTLVDGNGTETPYPPASLTPGPDGNLYLQVIVLRAKPNLQKAWYSKPYNQSQEAEAPDCFSNDGVTPDVANGATPPIVVEHGCPARSCAECPKNAWGSATDAAGNARDGKACADNKILAVFIPKHGVHQFKIPPASLKNFGIYVKQLSASGIALGTVKTFVGFDMTATFPVLVFKFGGFLPEDAVGKLAEMAQSLEAEEIVTGKIQATNKPALPIPAPAPAPVAAPAVQAPVDDLGLGLGTAPPAPAAPAAKRGPKPKSVEQAPVEPAPVAAAPAASVSDDELRAALGL